MGQHIEARVRNQPRGELGEQVAVQNGGSGPELFVYQGVLGLPVGQNRKIRHLRAGAGGGGDGHQPYRILGKIGHGLGTVHGAAAAQRHQQIRPELIHSGRSLCRQRHRGVGLHPVKKLHLLRLCQIGNPFGGAVFHKIGVNHQQQTLCAEFFQRRKGTCTGKDFCF